MMKTVEQFFKDYAVASLNGNAVEVAKFYAHNFIAASMNQSSTFNNDQKFIEWLNEVFEFNRRTGLQEMKVKNTESISMGKYFIKTTVTWAALFAKRPTEEIKFDIHYILNCSEEDYKIILYISEEDQEDLMKEKGLF